MEDTNTPNGRQNVGPPAKKAKKEHKRKKAPLSITLKPGEHALNISDATDLVLSGTGRETQRFVVSKPGGIGHFVVCLVDGLNGAEDFEAAGIKLHELKLPGTSFSLLPVERILVSIPPLKKQWKKMKQEKMNLSIEDLLLSRETMEKYNLPIHSSMLGEQEPGWLETSPRDGEQKIFALDCEFVSGKSLFIMARVSLIDYDKNVVFDEFIKPLEPVVDYKTHLSGVTREISENATVSFPEIQQKFLDTISSNDILIGHSLESDLKMMKVKHPRIVDTAYCYHAQYGPPSRPGLKFLAKTYLHREIQATDGSQLGHSSVEDAAACVDLIKMKIAKKNVWFGLTPPETPIYEMFPPEKSSFSVIGPNPRKWNPTQRKDVLEFAASTEEEVVDAYKKCNSLNLVFLTLTSESALAEIKKSAPPSTCIVVVGKKFPGFRINELLEKRNSYNKLKKSLDEADIRQDQLFTQEEQSELKDIVTHAQKGVLGWHYKQA